MFRSGERAWKDQRCLGLSRNAHTGFSRFENLEDGLTIVQIVKMFDGLTREQVKAVLDFTAHSLEAPTTTR